MAIPPTNANDVFVREVDDAVREDQLVTFWRRYGKLVLGLIALLLVGYAAWLGYEYFSRQQAGDSSEQLVQGLDAAERRQFGTADKMLTPLARDGNAAYRAAALMSEAGIALSQDNLKKASSLYGQVATDQSLPEIYRDLALIRQITAEFDTLKPEMIIARLKPIAVEGRPAFASAAELIALAYMNLKQEKDAGAWFARAAAAPDAAPSLKSRTAQMASMLGVSVPTPAPRPGDKP